MSVGKKQWISTVQTDSTSPPKRTIHAKCPNDRACSSFGEGLPQGSGICQRMLTYFINPAGRSLSAKRKSELEKAALNKNL
jgi:Protein of unknown function (DUF3175)